MINVIVTDNQPPAISCPVGSPFNRNTDAGRCYYTVQGTEFNPTISDNCPGATLINSFNGTATLAGAQLPKGTTAITWTATDASGLTSNCLINVIVTDNQPPAISCPVGSPFNRNTDAGRCYYTVQGTEFNPTISDNCPGATLINSFNGTATLAGAQLPKGTTAITWTATDASGLTSNCLINVIVTDNQPPAISCPVGSPFIRNTDASQCYYTVFGAEFNATFSDNCPGANLTNSFNGTSSLTNGHLPKGITVITWTATDASGLISNCSITVNVTDNQTPVITCQMGSPFSRNTDAGRCYYTVLGAEFNPTFSDNCPGSTIINSFNGTATLTEAQLPKGTMVIIWTATDASGLTSNCSISVNVTDNQTPAIYCPAGSPFNRNTDAGRCYYTVSGTEFNPTFSDNCAGTIIVNSFNGTSTLAGAKLPKGMTVITWTATDASGLASYCSFSVNVSDNQLPAITCPTGSPFIRNTDAGQCYYTVAGSEFNPTFSDNCPGATLINSFNWTTTLAGVQLPKGTTIITWTATDASGLISNCSITINVTDNQPPAISCPVGSPFSRNTDTGRCYYTVQGTEFNPSFSDNCAGTTAINSFNSTTTLAGAQVPKGSTIINWTAMDAAGNITSCSIMVVVIDNQLPTITCPANITRSNTLNSCSTSVAVPNPVIADNCEVTKVTWAMTGATIASSPSIGINYVGTFNFNVGVTTINYTVYDASNNNISCSFTVTVIDSQLPAITCPANIIRSNDPNSCYASIMVPNPTITDNCAVTKLTWLLTGATTGSSPASGMNYVGTHTFNVGVTTINYTVYDANNNSASCLFTITVSDTQLPMIICPGNIIGNNDPNACNAVIVVPNAGMDDNCAVVKLTWTMTGATTASSPMTGINYVGTYTFNVGITTVNYLVYDAAGNNNNCSFTVTINDTQVPTIICPANLIRNNALNNCNALVAVPNPSTADNCAITKLTWTMSGATSGSSPIIGINYVGTCIFNVGITTINYIVSDAANNNISCSFTVRVNDTQLPAITCPANIVADCPPGGCSIPVNTADPVASDNCAVTKLTWTLTGATVANSPLSGINFLRIFIFNAGVTTVSYTATDAANNSRTCSYTVNIRDLQPPVLFGVPAGITVTCTPVPSPPIIGTDIWATDNCDLSVSINLTEISTQQFNNTCESVIYQVTRTWVATDNFGNTDTAWQVINVVCECCTNGIDDDGNGLIDEEDANCPCSAPEYRLDCRGNLLYLIPPIWQMNPNYNGNPDLYTNPSSLVISSPFGVAHVNVRTGDGVTFNQNYTVTNGTSLEIPLNYNLVQTPNYNFPELNRGMIVETDQLIQVLYRLTASNNQVLVTIMGEQAYGMRFRAGSQTNVCGAPNTDKRENHFISVMAISDNTLVNFNFTGSMKGLPASHSVTLNAFQTYVVIDNDNNQTITGSRITANKDIAVVSGSQHSQQCTGGTGRDGAIDQLVPSCVAGTDYIVFRGVDDTNPSPANYAVITAIAANTQVFVNGGTTPVATLLPGQYYTYNMPGPNFSNHYIHTSTPAYCYQFGSVQNNGEIGMASVPPIHGCNGDKYIEFFKFPSSTINNITVVIPTAGLTSLTLNGNPYTNYTTAKTIPGFSGWNTVTFSDANLNSFNKIQSNELFHAGQFIGKTDAGAFGYLSSFKDKITVLHPVTGQPSVEYFADSICGGDTLRHCITSTSCSGGHYISNIIQGSNTGGLRIFPHDSCFEYIGKVGFTGIDSIVVMMSDQLGFTQPICLTYFVCGTNPEISCPPNDTLYCPADTSIIVNGFATAVDLCDNDLVITHSDSVIPGPCYGTYVVERTWKALNNCEMIGTCVQTLSVQDTTPPSFTSLPLLAKNYCVTNIITASFYPDTMDITPVRPDYYILDSEDKSNLHIDPITFWDNCTPVPDLTLHWRIDFAGGIFPPISGTGQISDYPAEILLPGAPNEEVAHNLTFWLEDDCNNMGLSTTVQIIVKPRPHVIKLY